MYADTIAAIVTGPGEAGVAIVRLSGPASLAILGRVFTTARTVVQRPRRLVHGWALSPEDGGRIDEVLAVAMPGPGSFTGEDVVELHCHGGRLAPTRVLEAALAAGARPAEPGEFSLRAFLNGRLDLAQAEALLDVVRARTERAQQLAMDGLAGRLSRAVRAVRAELVGAQAQLEASIDFSEEDLPTRDVGPELEAALAGIRDLLAGAEQGIVYRDGVRVAIVGRPNVGKSSLLNALLRTERAIVTEVPGTTRDTVEETANLDGVPFWLVDTAGLRDTADPVEQIGVERSRAALATADLVVLVLDAAALLAEDDCRLAAALRERRVILALNKDDLPPRVSDAAALDLRPEAPAVRVSALTGRGLSDLEGALVEAALGGVAVADPRVANPRHRTALRRAEAALEAGLRARADGLAADVLAGEVAAAVAALGEITGENATEDLLDAIFSRFCIGK